MEYQDWEMSVKMAKMMNRFPTGTKEYKLAQSTFAFLCERMRQKQKVELFYPPLIGSLEEKIQHETENKEFNSV